MLCTVSLCGFLALGRPTLPRVAPSLLEIIFDAVPLDRAFLEMYSHVRAVLSARYLFGGIGCGQLSFIFTGGKSAASFVTSRMCTARVVITLVIRNYTLEV